MKKNGFTLIELLVTVAIIGIIGYGLCTWVGGCQQIITRKYGGSMTVKLDPNIKLVNVTWKDDHLWLLTTARTNGSPVIYNFEEKSVLGILQGNVKIVEQ